MRLLTSFLLRDNTVQLSRNQWLDTYPFDGLVRCATFLEINLNADSFRSWNGRQNQRHQINRIAK
jgi:hypothetical protein